MSSKALFHVTVKGVIVYHDKILLLKKIKPSQDNLGFWELPGGGMEYDESPIEAMKREALEETGLSVDVIRPLSTFHVTRKEKQIVGISFLCHASSDKVQLSEEHSEYLWISQQEANNYLARKIMDTFNGEQVCVN